jgi:amino acid adenylation domain-containing protein
MSKSNIEDIYPLTPLQEGLLFHTLYAPEAGDYFQHLSFRLHGELDVARWQRSWQQVVARHSILRTAFVWERLEKPLQIVLRRVKVPWQVFDWRGLAAPEQQARLDAFLESDRRQGLDSSQAPMLRLTLIRLSDTDYEFICSQHHLLVDGWSTPIIINEVLTFYRAAGDVEAASLKPPRPYKAYIHWLQQQDLAHAESFWRATLKGFTEPTALADIFAAGKSADDRVRTQDEQQTSLSHLTSVRLQTLARRHELTMSTFVMGAWALLLSRYCARDDVVFGVTVSGRPASLVGVNTMVGPFINTLPLRVQLPPDMQLIAWLKQVQLRLLELREYEYSPLVKVQQWSDAPPGMPLFESLVVFANYPVSISGGPQKINEQLEVRNIRLAETGHYSLAALVVPGDELHLQLAYDARRFDRDTIQRMLGHFRAVLENIAANPQRQLSQLSILTEAEQRQLLVAWNDPRRDNGLSEKCLYELFEEQVKSTPTAIAVCYESRCLTYLELNRRANQLAHRLRALSPGAGACVGICVERSIEMVVGLLGIMKAGCAYIPLEPTLPEERIRAILEDGQVRVLLTQEQLRSGLSEQNRLLIYLDSDWEKIAQESEENPAGTASAENPAYVIYTSGSTGLPKGVIISHRAICNTLLWRRATFSLDEADRILQNLSFAFDASVWQIFGALISGAQLVLLPPRSRGDVAEMLKLIVAHNVTITDFTPSLLQAFLQERRVEQCHSLRHVFCGGESLTGALVEEFFARLRAELHNMYGPTETAVDATCWTCSHKDKLTTIPIGRPIANKQVYLLDEQLHPVPVGVTGEVYIGGAGLAHGYLNQPELTAEKFIPHPFSAKAGARLYRTGDLCRYLPDGNIEFLGRLDHQVKIRGFRIEPGEIEALLKRHDAVCEAIVLAREDVPGNLRLVAYVVPVDESANSLAGLRIFLGKVLPDYMIPSNFVRLEKFPLTPTGKIDRRALPIPEQAEPDFTETFTGAHGPIVEILAGMWTHILGGERPGLHDNFFALGGHSLKLARLLSKIRETFRVELTLRTLFERPTVAAQAEMLEAMIKEGQLKTLPAIERVPRDRGLPMSFAQRRLWFLDRLVPHNAFYNMSGAYRLTGSLNRESLEESLNEIIKRHEILRTTFAERESQLVQVIATEQRLHVPLVDLGVLAAAEREAEALRLAGGEAQRPFDLCRGPLLRATLVRLDEDEHILLLTMHHIISDGWSLALFLEELGIFYNARVTQSVPNVPELPIQYADFAAWQQQWFQGEVLEVKLNYWKQQLGSSSQLLELPTDRPRPATQSYRGANFSCVLPGSLVQSLKRLSHSESVTLFMTLLAAFQVLLSRYTGQEDIVVGSVTANRNRSEVEKLIGFFVSTVILRASLSNDLTFRELLGRVREVTLGAYAHQDVPFEMLVERLHPERSLSHNPLFQVMFTFQNLAVQEWNLHGLKVSPIQLHETTAKFDLTFSVAENGPELIMEIEYNIDLFNPATITRMAHYFQNLLQESVAHPDAPISRLSLLDSVEEHRILVQWNATARDFPRHLCIHHLFESQVERTPERLAVVSGSAQLSYAELNARSNQLAHHLRRLGVGPEVRVGLCLKRSVELLVAILAVLKAGGAYLPLDPQYPREHLSFMLTDAAVPLLLTESRLTHLFRPEARTILCLDAERELLSVQSRENPQPTACASNPAYLIYTSGSTGQPKGIIIAHEALVNHGLAVRDCYQLDAHDRVLHFASTGFDVAAEELFPTLLSGAKVVIRSDESARSIREFVRFVKQEEITVVNLPTPFWHEWVAELSRGEAELPESLRLVVIGSDQASAERYTAWRRAVGDKVRLINAYGPTEATITATVYAAEESEESEPGDAVPIGRPIANTEIYLLDGRLNPSPIGVTGEVYIGGAGLARGYWNRPDLTAERFIPHPFSSQAGARLYRTGDVGRYQPNGNVKLAGRMDEQVKVRGYRIELGEIEAVLRLHSGVKEAAVIAQDGAGLDRQLVAYVVAEPEMAFSNTDLKSFLKEKLPEYMVPAVYMLLQELPLTPNGKIDRRALPEPDKAGGEMSGQLVASRDFLEIPLIRLWENVLGVQPIGIKDNFFELGGHSILALRLMGAVHQRFGRELPLSILFEKPTVEHFAQALRQEFDSGAHSPLVPIQPAGNRPPIFFVHVGSGQVLCYVDLARRLGTDQPFYGLQDPHLYTREFPDISIEEMAAHYMESVRQIQPHGPYLLGGWSFGGAVAFEMATQFKRQGEEVAWLALLDAGSPDWIRRRADLDNDAALLRIIAHEIDLNIAEVELESLKTDEMLSYVAEKMRQAQLLVADPMLFIRRQLDVLKSRTRVIHNYYPDIYPGQITFFHADQEDARAPLPSVQEDDANHLTLGFAALSTAPVDVYIVQGNHHQIAREPHVRDLARALRNSLEQALAARI